MAGFGDGYNSYAHSMCWFEGRLYVGTARANLYLIRRRNPAPQWPIYPVNAPPDPFSLDLCAQIWRWDPRDGAWTHVHSAPMVMGREGQMVPREIGYRGMAVFQGPSDPKPVLYVSSFSPTRAPGPMILRSEDGLTFKAVTEPGLGHEGISAFRTLVTHQGRLYTSPVGSTKNRPNLSTLPVVFESADPALGRFRMVSEPGFGDPNNTAVFEMVAFNDRLYAATFNTVTGFEVWRTDAQGAAPYRWTQALRLGAYRGNLNQGAISLCPFRGALYIGTAIQDGGFDRANRLGPAAGELLRLWPDDSWDVVVGSPRLTPEGVKVNVSGLAPGFSNFFNGYIWRQAVHDDCLYVGTWDWSTFLSWSQVDGWPWLLREFIYAAGVRETIEREGGFDLWKSADGNHWEPVTRTGFGNRFNCGARTLVSTPHGLCVGSANPFGPEVAVRRGDGWEYVPNPRGGLEVWLGAPAESGPSVAADSVLGIAAAAAVDADVPMPTRRRGSVDIARFQLDEAKLRRLQKLANVPSVRPDFVANARAYHNLRLEGTEHIPRDRPAVYVSNQTGVPILAFSSFVSEDVLLFSHLMYEELRRPVWVLADFGYWDPPLAARLSRKLVQRCAFVPITVGNAVRVLEMGESVLVCPEGQSSGAGYQTRPFSSDFARMAWLGNVPVVPAAVIGPHESRPRIEREGVQVIVDMLNPKASEYKIVLLPPVDVRAEVQDVEDRGALDAFAECVRVRIQDTIDRQTAGRPLLEVVRRLQERYGDALPRRER